MHEPSLTSDDDVFRSLALTYAKNHPQMIDGLCENGSLQSNTFENGITNGAAWYSFSGNAFGGNDDVLVYIVFRNKIQ